MYVETKENIHNDSSFIPFFYSISKNERAYLIEKLNLKNFIVEKKMYIKQIQRKIVEKIYIQVAKIFLLKTIFPIAFAIFLLKKNKKK